jgi:hypothetical protein
MYESSPSATGANILLAQVIARLRQSGEFIGIFSLFPAKSPRIAAD